MNYSILALFFASLALSACNSSTNQVGVDQNGNQVLTVECESSYNKFHNVEKTCQRNLAKACPGKQAQIVSSTSRESRIPTRTGGSYKITYEIHTVICV